jgi:HlyD family secretion protein
MPEGSSLAPPELSAPPVLRRRALPRLGGRRGLMLGVAAVALVAVVAVIAMRAAAPPAATPAAAALTVTTVPVLNHKMAETLMVTGTLVPWEDLALGTETNGLTVTQVLVDEDDHVQAGQLLAKLDDAVLVAQLAQNQAQIDHAKAVIGQQEALIAQAEASLKTANNDVTRAHELVKSSNISVQTTEQREMTAAGAQATLQSARMGKLVAQSDLALAESQRAEIQARLAQTEIRAPTAGLVAKRMVRVGQVVSSGNPLFHMVRDGILEMDAEIPDRLLSRVAAGQEVKFSTFGGGDAPNIGKVRLVAPVVDALTRNGIAHIRLPEDARLKPGMFMPGELMLAQTDQLTVPESAVLTKDGAALVFVVDAEGKAAQRKIETGLRSDGLVAIRRGLQAGDQVVQSGAGFLSDGDLVHVVEAAK